MAAAVGTSSVLFRVGSGSPSVVYRGSTVIQGPPFFVSATGNIEEATSDGEETYVYLTKQGMRTYGIPLLESLFQFGDAPGDGYIQPYDYEDDGFYITAYFNYDARSQSVRVQAGNAIGYGPPSEWFNVADIS
jgi:hypothetical protein